MEILSILLHLTSLCRLSRYCVFQILGFHPLSPELLVSNSRESLLKRSAGGWLVVVSMQGSSTNWILSK
jgi:hypothetical protein